VYVNEPEETLSVCLEPTQDLDARIQQVFNTYMSAMDVLVSDPVTLMGSSYTTSWHRIIITEELWHGLILVSRYSFQKPSTTRANGRPTPIMPHQEDVLPPPDASCLPFVRRCQGFATECVIACIVMYSIIWHVPFNTHGMEFLVYFLTYYVSAALPTAVGLNWKRTAPDHVRLLSSPPLPLSHQTIP
jgi:hypothetical protein